MLNELALFAGAGGGILGGRLLGWNTVAAVEIERYPRECLLQRQRDGILPPFPVWDDVRTFDGRPWRGLVDVVSGGFPCQDISAAGKGAGIEGSRSGLWAEMHRIVCEVRPRYVFVENSPALTSRGLGRVLGDLAEAGYDAAWLVLGAADVGAPHRRDRIWILAETASHDTNTDGVQCSEQGGEYEGTEELDGGSAHGLEAGGDVADSDGSGWDAQHYEAGVAGQTLGEASEQQPCGAGGGEDVSDSLRLRQGRQQCGKEMEATPAHTDLPGREKQRKPEPTEPQQQAAERGGWWGSEPALGRVAHGVAHRVDRLKSIGNGQVPLVAATAFCELKRILEGEMTYGVD